MRSLIRLAVVAVLAIGLAALYNSPGYHAQFQDLWQQILARFSALEGQINSQVGYGQVSSLGPKQVGVSVPKSQANDWQSVGALGPDILSSTKSLKVEIDYTKASAPTASDEGTISAVLGRYSGKAVQMIPDELNLPIQKDYDLATIVKLTEDHRSCYSSQTQDCLYFLILPGGFENSSALGASFTSSAVALMSQQIGSGANPFVSRDRIAQATITHELGHIFGLVNLIGKEVRPHEDPSHPGHSSDPKSVMYWAVEDLSVSSLLSGGPSVSFDSDDEADIKLIGGR